MKKPAPPDDLQFCSLTLENVRAFAAEQTLNFIDSRGRPARWNLIIGENGVGKTTIMQCLASMRPIPSLYSPKTDDGKTPPLSIKNIDEEASDEAISKGDFGDPLYTQADLSQRENDDIHKFLRSPGKVTTQISATFAGPKDTRVQVGVVCEGDGKQLVAVDFTQYRHELKSTGPLVIGYGASRHIGHANAAVIEGRDPTDSLFREKFDLFDAEEILDRLNYAYLAGKRDKDKKRLNAIKEAVADLVPELKVREIEIRGPQVPGRPDTETGIHVATSSAVLPLSSLSLGAQTMFAWTVDLAWRMFNAFPNSRRPLSQSAIVLVDEIDLHLHPRWQRILRSHLGRHFPKVQFIATTHSPVTAQETLAAGGNVAVVRWDGNHTIIINEPLPSREWRVDQVLTSDLFGFDTSRGPEADKLLRERRLLLRKRRLTQEERARLKELDLFEASLPTAATPEDQEFEDWVIKVGQLEGTLASTSDD